jgi:hypothetical protein
MLVVSCLIIFFFLFLDMDPLRFAIHSVGALFLTISFYYMWKNAKIKDGKIDLRPPYSGRTLLGISCFVIAAMFYVFTLINPVLVFLNPPGPTFTLQNYLSIIFTGIIAVFLTILGVYILKRR